MTEGAPKYGADAEDMTDSAIYRICEGSGQPAHLMACTTSTALIPATCAKCGGYVEANGTGIAPLHTRQDILAMRAL